MLNLITENLNAILILLINFLVSISYFVIYSNSKLKNSFFKIPVLLQKFYVALFVFPLFTAPFFSKTIFANTNIYFIISGIVITVLGISIILLSFFKIGTIPSIKNDGKLSTAGTYRIVRHPIYLGTIISQIGLILLNQALVPLFYLPVSITLYYIMASIEEKDLVKMFGKEYIDFQTKTKFKIIPFIL